MLSCSGACAAALGRRDRLRCSRCAGRHADRRHRRSLPTRRASSRSAARSPRSSMRSARKASWSPAIRPASIREAALTLPDVGYMRALSPEGVLSVNPTGILALARQRPEGSGRCAEEGERALHRGARDTSTMTASSKRSASSARRSASTPRPKRWRPRSMPRSKAAEKLTAGDPGAQARAVHPVASRAARSWRRAATPPPTASSSWPAASTPSRAFPATSSCPTRRSSPPSPTSS